MSHADEASTEQRKFEGGPGALRGVVVLTLLAMILWLLTTRVETGEDKMVRKLGRIEVTAKLVERPEQFPDLGAYRYTYVLKYHVLKVHRQDPERRYLLQAGDDIFVGHYKPWMPRSEVADADWGKSPIGGMLNQFVTGEAHRMAVDYELQDLTPSGALDYCFPAGTNRFFALWTNPTGY